LTGCESNSSEVNQQNKDLEQANQTIAQTQKELNESREKYIQLENNQKSIADVEASNPDLLAVQIKQLANEISTNDSIGGNTPILFAYILASHLTPNMVYIKNDTVSAKDPVIEQYSGNILEKKIKTRFIKVIFNNKINLPIYARGFENQKVMTHELLFLIDSNTNLPVFYLLREDGDFDHYILDSREEVAKNYNSQIWVDELLDYTNKRDKSIKTSGTE
jgi:hypothetical protein